MGIDPDSYGPMLIPVIMPKLPENLKLTIPRQFGQDIWNIKLMLEAFKNELTILEKLSLTKAADKAKFEFNTASGTCLYTTQVESKFSCIFCHPKQKPQHCTQRFTCSKCQGKHHISICGERKRTHDHSSKSIQKQSPSTAEIETQTDLNDTPCNVLLQTTVANVSISDKYESAFRLLFDSGPQRSYVSPKVKALLNPEIKAKKEVALKTFGENTSNKILDVVELVVASKTADEDIELKVFVTDICHPLKTQNTKFVKKKFSHIRNLT